MIFDYLVLIDLWNDDVIKRMNFLNKGLCDVVLSDETVSKLLGNLNSFKFKNIVISNERAHDIHDNELGPKGHHLIDNYINENNINSYLLNRRGEEYYGMKDSDNIFNVFTKGDNILVGGMEWDLCLHRRTLGFSILKKRNLNIYSSPDICIKAGEFITTNDFNSDEKIEWDTLDNNTFKAKKLSHEWDKFLTKKLK